MHDCTDRLPLERCRVYRPADVFDANVVENLDPSGARVDSNVRRVSAIAVGTLFTAVTAFGGQAKCSDLRPRFCTCHALDAVRRNPDLLGAAAQGLRGGGADRDLKLARRIHDRRATHHDGARAIGAIALLEVRRRAVQNRIDALDRQFQGIGGDLRHHGLDALTDATRSRAQRDRSIALKAELDVLARPGGAALDVTANPQTMVSAIDEAALQRSLISPADRVEATLEGDRVITTVALRTGVVGRDARQLVGHLGARHQITAPHLEPVDAQIARGEIE